MVDSTQDLRLGSGGVGRGMITFFGLEHMVDATQNLRLGSGGVGWGGMITFLGLENMVVATQDLRLGSGGVKFLHIERRKQVGCSQNPVQVRHVGA